jgi:hypothetical protein
LSLAFSLFELIDGRLLTITKRCNKNTVESNSSPSKMH